MLPLEHSAILLTCIKRGSVLKTIFGHFESGRFTQVLLHVDNIHWLLYGLKLCICTRGLLAVQQHKPYIEDIYFFEVKTKYISSSVLKTSDFSRVRSTSENSDVFNSRSRD